MEFKYDQMTLFKEINASMIATDSRFQNTSLSHNAIILASLNYFISKDIYSMELGHIAALSASFFSAITIITLDRFQWWKNHYIDIMRNMWSKEIDADESLTKILPKWITGKKRRNFTGADFTVQIIPALSWSLWYITFLFSIHNSTASVKY